MILQTKQTGLTNRNSGNLEGEESQLHESYIVS